MDCVLVFYPPPQIVHTPRPGHPYEYSGRHLVHGEDEESEQEGDRLGLVTTED